LGCSRYIELNPVKANIVELPIEYKWSSYMCNAHGESNRLTNPHDIYNRLGSNEKERQQAYAFLFTVDVDPKETQFIRNAVHFSMPTGNDRFQYQIEQALNRKLGYAYRGRLHKSRKVG